MNKQIDRTIVEERVMEHIEKIREANHLETVEHTYDFIIENWYMYDAFWLQIVTHMHRTGRLQ